MAIVLPHGVLFRGAGEGTIRQILLENGSIYAVIGLPSNMFYNTSIPTCIIVLKKHREGRDVLFIDASKLFKKEKKQNVMTEEHINKVLELYKNRQTVDKVATLASFEDIKANDFNLNIPRYVDTSEPEPEIDLNALSDSIKATSDSIKKGKEELLAMMNNLTFNKPETEQAVAKFIKVMQEV
jgi:type I restriction enzyme M protein